MLLQVNTAFKTFVTAPTKDKLALNTFASVCQDHNPKAFLDNRLADFTADGALPFSNCT